MLAATLGEERGFAGLDGCVGGVRPPCPLLDCGGAVKWPIAPLDENAVADDLLLSEDMAPSPFPGRFLLGLASPTVTVPKRVAVFVASLMLDACDLDVEVRVGGIPSMRVILYILLVDISCEARWIIYWW